MNVGRRKSIVFTIDGEPVYGFEGDTVASALLRAGITTFTRSVKYHRPRGPFCFGGSCGQCLMRVDGIPSLPACRVPLEEGMKCARQNAPLGAEADLLRATDFLFPSGLDHHHLLVQSRLLGQVALQVARRLAGLGELPDEPQPPVPGALLKADIAVIGGGPAGIAAARAAGSRGARVLLFERDGSLGGGALLGVDPDAPGLDWVEEQQRALLRGDVEVLLDAEVVGLYPNESPARADGDALLAVRRGQGLVAVIARRVVVATGGVPEPFPFPGVDRPGVYAARGLVALARQTGLLVGARDSAPPALAVAGEGKELIDCARALRTRGYGLARVVDLGAAQAPAAPDLPLVRGRPLRARGRPVRELRIAAGAGEEAIRCDAVAIALPLSPLHELATSAGARAHHRLEVNGFPVEVDAHGRTAIPWLFAAGRAACAAGAAAESSGARAGFTVAGDLAEARP